MGNNPELISKGNVLINDLQSTLEKGSKFSGTYAFVSKLTSTPNPCLHVNGGGVVGLPLSAHDAQSIIKLSELYSRKASTSKKVGDMWEINAQNISFSNQEWDPFVQNLAVKTVCQALGVQTGVVASCELHKLFIYEGVSQPIPILRPISNYQDVQNTQRIFARMVILLPSAHIGGRVDFSNGSQKQSFHLDQNSIASTSVLAWYTNVMATATPITSGFRLALSYNLLYPSIHPTSLKPVLPDMDGQITKLRGILKKWKSNGYSEVTENKFVCCLFEHQYTKQDLLRGTQSLRGIDANKVSFLRPIAVELGYMVCLGTLTYRQYGFPNRETYDEDIFHCGCSDYDDYDDGLSMRTVEYTEMNISHVVDSNGALLFQNGYSVDEGCLIPNDAFKDALADDQTYNRDDEMVERVYHRTVLILIQDKDASKLFCSQSGGFKYWLNQLNKSDKTNPSKLDEDVARALIESLKQDPDGSENAKIMVDYAFEWKDPLMWSSIMKRGGVQYFKKFGKDKYFEGWDHDRFSFANINNGLTATLMQFPVLKERLDFIDIIQAHAEKIKVVVPQDWHKQQLVLALSKYQVKHEWNQGKPETYSEDVEMLLRVARTWGLQFVRENALHSLSNKQTPYNFWVRLVQQLTERPIPCTSADTFDCALKHCLSTLISQWDDVPTSGYLHNSYYGQNLFDTKVNRIIQIMELCFSAGCLDPCRDLFTAILTDRTDITLRFQTFFVPLIPKFVGFLIKHKLTLTSPPFDSFLREVVSLYLHHVLGSSSSALAPRGVQVQKIGCGCIDCNQLDQFMADFTQKSTFFRMKDARRRHIEQQLYRGRANCDWTTIRAGSPYLLQITKKPGSPATDNVMAKADWQRRAAEAFKFLTLFGSYNLLPVLMGTRWDDVTAAMEGTRQFSLDVAPQTMSAKRLHDLTNVDMTSVVLKKQKAA